MTEQPGSSESFDQEDLDAFIRKLDGWASTLTASDRALLQLVLDRNAAAQRGIDTTFQADQGVGSLVEPFLRELVEGLTIRLPGGSRPMRPKSWVQAGEPWIQSAQ